MTIIKKQYKGLNYEIENHENGSNFEVYEYTPILKQKKACLFGASCKQNDYTCEYVESLIDDAINEVANPTPKDNNEFKFYDEQAIRTALS